MKIGFLLGNIYSNGGIARVTSILANELAEKEGVEVTILNYVKSQTIANYNLSPKIRQSYLFDYNLSMSKAIIKGGGGKIRKIIEENEIEILIACGALYFPLAVIASRSTDVKVIAWEHSNSRNNADHKFQKLCRIIGSKYADAIITLTKRDQQLYTSDFKAKNVEQIYNPVDQSIDAFVREYDGNSKKIISIGRLGYQKNFENLIDIAKKILPNNSEWTWDIYGTGEQFSRLKQLIKYNGLESQLFLKGQADNLYELYPSYSLQVMTSRYEGFPMTLLEGMAHGLPLISYDIETGPNEIIEDSINGFLIKPFETDEMIDKIQTLIDNPKLRKTMSAENLSKKNNFELYTIVEKWLNLLQKIRD